MKNILKSYNKSLPKDKSQQYRSLEQLVRSSIRHITTNKVENKYFSNIFKRSKLNDRLLYKIMIAEN